MPVLEEILAEITTARLEPLIIELANSREPGERLGIDVGSLIGQIVAGRDLGAGAERSQAYRRIVDAIRENVAVIEGMKYLKSSD